MFVGGRLTLAKAKKQRKALMAEIDREQRRKDREALADLRKQIREAERRRREAVRQAA